MLDARLVIVEADVRRVRRIRDGSLACEALLYDLCQWQVGARRERRERAHELVKRDDARAAPLDLQAGGACE